jgi:hypothetical protein
LIVLLSAVLTITVYFTQYGGGPGNPIESLLNPLSVVNFTALLLGSPVAVVAGMNYTLGYVSGYLLLGTFGYAAYRIYIQRKIVDNQQIRSLLFCMFCIGVCFMTALGRGALAYRYMLIPTLYILAMPGLFSLRPPIKGRGKQLVVVVFLFGVLGLSGAAYLNDDALRSRQFMIRDGAIAAAFGTDPLYRGLSLDRNKINNHVCPFFIKHHGDSRSVNMLTWIGKPIPQDALPDPSDSIGSQSMGHIDSLENRKGDSEFDVVQGWVRLGPKGRRKAEWVIITNTSGVVVGLATTGIERPDVRNHLQANWLDDLRTQSNRAGFSGLIRSQPDDELNFYSYDDGTCYQFADNVKAPEADTISSNE